MALYAVTDPTATYVYIALDYTDADTLALVKKLNTGLIRVNLTTNAVEKVATGCVVAPIPSNYYTRMQSGDKPIQFDDDWNVVFNGYRLKNGIISTKPGLKRVTLPAMTVTELTDDSQSVVFFKAMGNGDIAFQAINTLDSSARLFLWKTSAGEISLASSLVYYLLKDSYKNIIYKESTGSAVTFARSKDGGGVDRVKLPNSTAYALVGDDGNFYGLDSSQPDGAGSVANVLVSTILPYAATTSKTIAVDNVIEFPWTSMPVQISKGYLYFVANIDPGDGYGTRSTINVQRLHGTDRITILSDKRYTLYAWRQTGGYDKLYFTARDMQATAATIYSGVIDTVKLHQGLPQDQYLTLQAVASATGSAAQVKDLEVLSPQVSPINPGYVPYIADVSKSIYSEGLTFSKYMNNSRVESNIQLTTKAGATVPYLPVWILASLYIVPDLNGLGNVTTTPLDESVCYAVNMNVNNIVDYWDVPLWDKNSVLPVFIGSACNVVNCSYILDKSALTFDSGGGSQSVTVTATADSCAWVTAIPTDASSWLSATAGATGGGTASVTAAANTATDSRSATIQVAGKDVTVTQTGATLSCTLTVSPMTISAPAAASTQTINVTVSPSGCTGGGWTATENLGWVSITSGNSGTGSGTVTLSIDANNSTTNRTGTVQVADKTVSINQAGSATSTFTLPDSGQTKCYNNSIEITCPSSGQDFYGQDGNYQGVQPSYQNNGDGTVTDQVTGLIWQQADDGVARTWNDAGTYCQALGLGGRADWRLPSIDELLSIVDSGRFNPAINPVFTCSSDFYWSDTTNAGTSSYAWAVSFRTGDTSSDGYGRHTNYVRCVHGGPLY